MENIDKEPEGPYDVFGHPDFPNVELWILRNAEDPDGEIRGISVRGATQQELPFLLETLTRLAPGVNPEIIP